MPEKIRIAVTSFLTEEASWSLASKDVPDITMSRLNRIYKLANAIIKSEVRPDYVVFPELSLPRKCVKDLAKFFLRERISLIAGVEYGRWKESPKNTVVNDARLYLTDSRLGYPSFVVLTQRKGFPSHLEKANLRDQSNLGFPPIVPAAVRKRIYRHNGFNFGLLVCSELTDVNYRAFFRGKIDNLFVLSWNRDLDTFSYLTEASCLDMHCFITLVNNRLYGDSRVRGPYKDSWRRDVVRVKGGACDYFVIAELEIDSLRKFQSHHKPPDSPFKPFPEGFEQSNSRRIPPVC